MADKHTKEQRRKNMQAIKSQSKLEDIATAELWRRGMRFRRNVKSLFGKPDIAIKKYKIVVFIDSCFWHGCDIHGNMPKSNKEYWEAKLKRNKVRDSEVTSYYKEKGWNILRIWEHEFKKDFNMAIDKIEKFIKETKDEFSKRH
ncbi:very short patch repair endonuclease [Bacillus sp. FMQ74]|uniref:very short patch repair endonuclease n=1 Tax=Bacillus sp. FMQ74 TaxID=1913579 RepID=UPI0008FAE75A|nr:very short patch repair endonuclease [Bacillus sp. FMQ74]OIR59889.1 very short patch repair endonuclease [Bacillus sp. FMQ74]